jgi:mevalonate kinase
MSVSVESADGSPDQWTADGTEPRRRVTTATAPGKTILLGEHAVVYGRPAIAVPVSGRRARVSVIDAPQRTGVTFAALDLGQRYPGTAICVDDDGRFLQAALRIVLAELGISGSGLDLVITIRSKIPIARGMGSGAAVSAALMRAVASHVGTDLDAPRLSRLVFETERLLHGTPSGIDNATVAFDQPVWYLPGYPAEPFVPMRDLTLLIGDTGVRARTRDSVTMVRERRESATEAMDARFDAIGEIVSRGRSALASGDLDRLGRLMDANQLILAEIGVSSGPLDRLIGAARAAGALGAKLSGGGMGGCMIALVDPAWRDRVASALMSGGAVQVITSTVAGQGSPSGERKLAEGAHA